jgi:hypothetical protein
MEDPQSPEPSTRMPNLLIEDDARHKASIFQLDVMGTSCSRKECEAEYLSLYEKYDLWQNQRILIV